MDTIPDVTSGGALWISTPLLAAAQLWSWHPLWAAGIWTLYGIGALIPQGEAWLVPITESPRYANFDPVNPLCRTPGLRKVPMVTTAHDQTTSIVVTRASTKSSIETTTSSILQVTPSSVRTVNVTSLNSPPSHVQASLSTPLSSSSSFAPFTTQRVPSASSVFSDAPSSIDNLHAIESSTSTESMRPSAESGLEPVSYSPGSVSARLTEPSYPLRTPHGYHEPLGKWRSIGNLIILGCTLKELTSTTFLVVWVLWMLRLGVQWMWHFLVGLNIPQRVQHWYHTGVQRVHHLRFHHHLPHHLVLKTVLIRQWFAHFIWGTQNPPHVRILRAGVAFLICMIPAHYHSLLLAGWIANLLSVAILAISVPVKGPKSTAHPSGSTSASYIDAVTVNSTSTSILVMSFTWLSQIERCTISALHNRLFPDGTYIPTPTTSSSTAALCRYIEGVVMDYRTLPLLVQTTSIEAVKNCTASAWRNRLSATGGYRVAHQSGLTASLCATIERLIMEYRNAKQMTGPYIAALNGTAGLVRRFLGCLPLTSMMSGHICPTWAHDLNRLIVMVLLTILFALNACALRGRPTSQPQSPFLLAKRTLISICLLFLPVAGLRVFPWSDAELVTMASTFGVLWFFRERLATKWNSVLQRLRIAPANNFEGVGHTLQRSLED